VPQESKLIEAFNLHSFEAEDLGSDCIEIDLPANRYSDAASHIGIAREAAAIFGLKFQSPVKTIVNPPADQGFLKIEIRNPKLCSRYCGRYFEINPSTHSATAQGGERGRTTSSGRGKIASSPLWMQKILKTCGLKPINNIVDLMNYVMLETGQPLHAFDADKIANIHESKHKSSQISAIRGQIRENSRCIIVRKAKKGEKIETLDGQKFILDSDALVITDSIRPLAIAGIKGGEYAGVTKRTKRIIVEAANFDSVNIFKTSRKLKLLTDAAIRFSHNISPELVQIGMDRATELLQKIGARLADSVDVYLKPVGEEVIEFDVKEYEDLIGAPILFAKAKKYFQSLGFSIENNFLNPSRIKEAILVRVPAWRTDIENFEDLAEEVNRLEGYNSLKPKPPLVGLKPAVEEDSIVFKDKIRNILINFQLDEVYNYSFVGDADICGQYADKRGLNISVNPRRNQRESALVELENPVSQEFKYLRPSLEIGLIKNTVQNSRFFDKVRIFEVGKVFQKSGSGVRERLLLGIVLATKKQSLVLELKGILSDLLKSVGIIDFAMIEAGDMLRIESDHQVLGNLKSVHLKKGWVAAVSEIDLDKFLQLVEEEREFRPLPKYPSVIRDISILVSGEARIGDIVQLIQEANPKLIEDVDLIDEYDITQINADTDADKRRYDIGVNQRRNLRESAAKQSLTFRIIFQAEDRTLTDAEVNREMEKIGKVLRKKFRAEIR